MKVTAVKTHKIIPNIDKNLFAILDKYLPKLEEGSVVVITSKIVSICEGRVVKIEDADKDKLIYQEAQLIIPPEKNSYNVSLTVNNNKLVAGAGIDESNGNGYYILWPKNPQQSVDQVREYLTNKYKLKKLGVVITDSKTTPLRWGVTGLALVHSGFRALNDYVNTPDLFGRKFKFEKSNIADALAAAAVLVMGEGAEQTPICVVEDMPFVRFQDKNPTHEELEELKISLEDDLYAELLKNAPWEKGENV